MGEQGQKATDALRGRRLRVTPQRRAILEAFSGGRCEHLTADEVYARVRRALPDISRATVYTTLSEFTRAGLLAALGRSEPVRYETNVEPHPHFLCVSCRRIYDVAPLSSVEAGELVGEGFVVERATVALEGTCASCRAFEDALHRAVAATRSRPAGALATRLRDADEVARGVLDSPVGTLAIAAGPRGIVRVAFPGQPPAGAIDKPSKGPASAATRALDAARRELNGYFDGTRRRFDVPVDWDAVAGADRQVLRRVSTIPYGHTETYAGLLPTTERPAVARAVGHALGANPIPILIPCHRVIRAAGDLVDYVGGIDRKQRLQQLELANAAPAPSRSAKPE